MPRIRQIDRWNEDPEYSALPAPEKAAILKHFFDKNLADSDFQKLPSEERTVRRNDFSSYHTPPEAPPAQIAQPPQPEETTREQIGRLGARASDVAAAGLTGAAEGLTTQLPGMVGGAMEFAGSGIPGDITATMRETTAELGGDTSRVPDFSLDVLRDVGKDLKDWAEAKRQQWFGPPKKREGLERAVFEGSKMLAPSVLPGAIVGKGIRVLSGVGKLVKASKAANIAGNTIRAAELMDKANKAANMANNIASAATASMFGLSQAQQTRDTAEKQAEHLESQGKFDEARDVRASGQGPASLGTGVIEAAGEYYGTKYLGKLFRLDEAGVAKRGVKNLVKDFMKTLGVEVSTEVGQQAGQAGIEQITGIRPEADPIAEALDVVGPTMFMTLLTGGLSGAIDVTRESSDSINILDEVREDVTPEREPVNVNLIKRQLKAFREEVTGPPSTAEEAVFTLLDKEKEDRAQLQRLGIPGQGYKSAEFSAEILEGAPEILERPPIEPAIGPPPTAREAAETLVSPEAVQEELEREKIEREGLPGPKKRDVRQIKRLGLQVPRIKPAEESARIFEEEQPLPTPPPATSPPPTILAESEKVDTAANEAATSPLNAVPQPTEAQKDKGNYKLGHVNIQGLDISIENPKGSVRSGKDSDGETWETKMKSHYGYIKGTVGRDKDHLDVFIGENPENETVFVVDQINPETKRFDEHKVMIGFKNIRAARKGYLANYESGWEGLGAITRMPIEEFKEWAHDKKQTIKPLKYKEERDERSKEKDKEIRQPEEAGKEDDSGDKKDDEKEQVLKQLKQDISEGKFIPAKTLREHPGLVKPEDIIEKPGKAGKKVEQYSVSKRVSPIGFYSAVQESVNEMDFKKIPANDLANRVKKLPGIKAEELEHLGLTDWLEGMGKDKITKEQVAEFIKAGGVQLEEIILGDPKIRDRGKAARTQPKFEQWQMSGEKDNYREVLLTLPVGEEALEWRETDKGMWAWFSGSKQVSGAFPLKTDRATAKPTISKGAVGFTGGHWEEPNVLAHVRLNDRVDESGKRTLFIEEIQSDWHQKGRKKGYRDPVIQKNYNEAQKKRRSFTEKMVKKYGNPRPYNLLNAQEKTKIDRLSEEVIGWNLLLGTVPQAPFKTSWPLLVFKRVLRMASEQGYDAVAWTPGDVQVDRYDLSKHLSELRVFKQEKGGYLISADDLNGNNVISKVVSDDELEGTIGKDLAERVINGENLDPDYLAPPDHTSISKQTFKDDNLKVGGEGMKGFYDKMLPNIVGKYVKKLDKAAKVGTTEVGGITKGLARKIPLYSDWVNQQGYSSKQYETLPETKKDALRDEYEDLSGQPSTQEVWSLPLTDKLKSEIMVGQPLFQVGGKLPGKEPVRTINLIESVFPGQDIEAEDDSYVITLKNGLKVNIERVAEITPKAQASLVKGYGKEALGEGEYIAGVYIHDPKSGETSQIKISTKAGINTLHHESIHLLEDFGIITKLEAGRINRHIKQSKLWNEEKSAAENRADWLANEANKPASTSRLGKLWNKIKEFVGNLVNKLGIRTVGGVVRDIKTGKIYEKGTAPGFKSSEQYAVERTGEPTEESKEQPGFMRHQFDEFIYSQQDKFNYLNKAQMEAESKNRSELPEEQNTYQREARWTGIATAALEDFQEEYVEPIQEVMSVNDISIDEAGEYLHARHAKEANTRLKEINPDRADNESLSGMTDSESDAILTRVGASPQATSYKELGQMHDRITKAHRDILVESGQETKETIQQWEDTYDFYAPLMREGKSEGKMPRRGRGFDVRGKQKIRAGSTRGVVNILAHTVANTEAAIIRAEKLKVARTFLEFARNNEGPWEIDTVEYSPRFNAEGMIEYRPDPLFRDADNVMIVKEGDINHRIVFDESDHNAMRIASAMKNLNASDSGSLVRTLSKAMRFLAIVNTSANVEFLFSNPFRDVGTAFYNMSDSEADAVKWKTIREIPKAWKGMRQFQKGNKNTEWAKWYDRFRKAGGKTGWMQGYDNMLERQKALEKTLRMKAGKPLSIKRGLRSAIKYIEDMNDIGENGIRLSLFKNLVENGVSDGRAAFIDKEVTVNFNRKGAHGQLMNSLYLFYSASIGGSARIIKAATKSAKVRKLMAGTVVFAAGLDMLNRAVGGVDDDGEDRYDKVPDWVKERNMIMMFPDSSGYAQLMLPWGYNVLHVIGQVIGEQFTKKDADPLKGALRIASATISSFNPVGGEASIAQVISPTLVDPIIQWGENKDWAGRKIRPDSNVFAPRPSSQTYWNSVSEPSRIVAEKINELTGGDVIKPGKIDISPEAIDLAIGTITGGAGKFLKNLISAPIKLAKGEEIESYEIPILRRVYGRIGNQALTQEFYESMDAVRLVQGQLEHYSEDKKKLKTIADESKREIKSIGRMETAKKQLKKFRKQKKSAKKIKNYQRRKRAIKAENEKIKAEMRRFNKHYKMQKGRVKNANK